MTGSCRCGKATFSNRGKAERAVRGIKRNGERREKTPQRAYPCPSGHGWHLTSQEGDRSDVIGLALNRRRLDRDRRTRGHRTRERLNRGEDQ